METSSLAASRLAAQRHARSIAAGPPRTARWTAPAAGVTAIGAAAALPVARPAAYVLVALAGLLLAVHRGDRRNAWRYVPVPVAPAFVLPPLRPAERPGVIDLTALEQAAAVGFPAQAVPAPALPRPRAAVDALLGARPRASSPPSPGADRRP